MNRIIKDFLEKHIKEYDLNNMDESTAFEHLVNRCIMNRYITERFDPYDIMTGPGEKGIDGIGIIVNGRLILTEDDISDLPKNEELKVNFVFIQSKTSEKFCASEIGDFIYGVKSFFQDVEERPVTNERIEGLIRLKNILYSNGIELEVLPTLEMYYVCCGKWNDDNGLQHRIDLECKPLKENTNFSEVKFYKYDAECLRITYKEMKKKIKRTFKMEKRISFDNINGVKQAYIGMVRCKDFINIISNSEGNNMLSNIFEDNVRDFQGYNSVNDGIKKTINDKALQDQFAILNNGITIIANSIKTVGDNISISDYQIVNGCQTSYVLFDNKSMLTENSSVIIKLIEVENSDILDKVIYTTNRQTEVKEEAFIAISKFQKKLQDTYNSYSDPYRLYYERRSKQYDLDDQISKNKVVSLTIQIKSYIAMFLKEPHSTHRYYGELLSSYKSKIFLEEDLCEIYYIAGYYYYYVDKNLKNDQFRKYKKYKYHILFAMRGLIVGIETRLKTKKDQKNAYEMLNTIKENEEMMNKYFRSAVYCLQQTIVRSDIPQEEQYRNREFTNQLCISIKEMDAAKKDDMYLRKGDKVKCYVECQSNCCVSVKLKTTDTRDKGQILKMAGKQDFEIGKIYDAEITSEVYDKIYGWNMKLIENKNI